MPNDLNQIYIFGDCELNAGLRSVSCAGMSVQLKPKTFDILLYLLEHADRIATKEELLTALWPNTFVEESNLSQHVFLLRKALAKSSLGDGLIITLPGRGYRIGPPVETRSANTLAKTNPANYGATEIILESVETSTTVLLESEEEDDTHSQTLLQRLLPAAKQNKKWVFAATAFLLALIASVGAYTWYNRPRPILRKVLLTPFQNTTGEALLDDTLDSGLRIELEQTPYIQILSKSLISETLAQMEQPPATLVSGSVAREICERNNFQVVLSGKIARAASNYVLTLDAVNCHTGATIDIETETISDENNAIAALSKATTRMRRELGESRKQIASFDVPVESATTSSLEALRDYSLALKRSEKDDRKGARELLHKAVALDPNFASAWRRLAANYDLNFDQKKQALEYYQRAFDLREHTSEAERLNIEIAYYGSALGDLERAAATARKAVGIYPDNEMMWGNLCNYNTMMGKYPDAIDACEHALKIDPTRSLTRLAIAYRRNNQLDDSKRIIHQVLNAGKGTFMLHTLVYEIAWLQQDDAALALETEWLSKHDREDYLDYDAARAAASVGRIRDSAADFSRGHDAALKSGREDVADDILGDETDMLANNGKQTEALAKLNEIKNKTLNAEQMALYQAEIGNTAALAEYLDSESGKNTGNTLHDKYFLPIIRATLAEAQHRPLEGLLYLELARPYQMHDYSVPSLRAKLEVEAGLLDAAEADYRLILANPGVDPLGAERVLANLELARVLVKKNQPILAREQYKIFLNQWKNADHDSKILADAKREVAALH